MYGIKDDLDALPPMPVDGDPWPVMHSWALPTRSFLEFVMFSRYSRLHQFFFVQEFLENGWVHSRFNGRPKSPFLRGDTNVG